MIFDSSKEQYNQSIGSNRYEDQLKSWQTLFKKEGREITSRQGDVIRQYPSYAKLDFFYNGLLLDYSTGLLLSADSRTPSSLDTMSQMMVYSYLYHRHPNAHLLGSFVSYEKIKGNVHMSKWSGIILNTLSDLKKKMEEAPEEIIAKMKKSGGSLSSYGDFSCTVHAFFDVPITYVLWKGDDEFPSNINVLFDSNILDFVHQESVVILSRTGADYLLDVL